MNEKEMMGWIDNASYKQLLMRWRNAPVGDQMFVGDVGVYYKKRMAEKSAAVDDAERVRTSKDIGWKSGVSG